MDRCRPDRAAPLPSCGPMRQRRAWPLSHWILATPRIVLADDNSRGSALVSGTCPGGLRACSFSRPPAVPRPNERRTQHPPRTSLLTLVWRRSFLLLPSFLLYRQLQQMFRFDGGKSICGYDISYSSGRTMKPSWPELLLLMMVMVEGVMAVMMMLRPRPPALCCAASQK